QLGRYDEAMTALRQAERLASLAQANDVLATVCGNQANVLMFEHRYDQALTLAERSVSIHEAHGSGHGLAVALATLAQICVRLDEAVRLADEIVAAGAPPFDALQATLIGAEALTAGNHIAAAAQRLAAVADKLDPRVAPATWAEYLRLRGAISEKSGAVADAYHDFAQSATLLDLLGERYQTALSHLAIGRLVARSGAQHAAEQYLDRAESVFTRLGAERDLADTVEARQLLKIGRAHV